MSNEQRFLTTEEVAELLRTSPETLRYWHQVGKGPRSVKFGRRRLYPHEAVENFIASVLTDNGPDAA